jgi:hypothetical protein
MIPKITFSFGPLAPRKDAAEPSVAIPAVRTEVCLIKLRRLTVAFIAANIATFERMPKEEILRRFRYTYTEYIIRSPRV